MVIEDGWKFHSADFSVQSHLGDNNNGQVVLVRSPSERKRWHKMSDRLKDDLDGPPLFVTGVGVTLKEAIENANKIARQAQPIV